MKTTLAADGRRYVVVLPRNGATPVSVFSLDKDDRPVLQREVDELPTDLVPVGAGAPIVAVVDEERTTLALVLASRESSRGKLVYLEDTRTALRDAPEGRLQGALGTPPSLIVATETRQVPELASYPIVPRRKSWPKPQRTPIGKLGIQTAVPGSDRLCGAKDERTVPLLTHGDQKGSLFFQVAHQLTPHVFDFPKGAELRVVCGACAPTLLSSRSSGVELLLPVRQTLAKQALATPIAFSQGATWRTVRASCGSDWYLWAFLSDGRLIAQSAEAGSWQTSAPTVLAQANDSGTPKNPVLVTTPSGVLVLWQRQGDSKRIRIEYASSKDGTSFE